MRRRRERGDAASPGRVRGINLFQIDDEATGFGRSIRDQSTLPDNGKGQQGARHGRDEMARSVKDASGQPVNEKPPAEKAKPLASHTRTTPPRPSAEKATPVEKHPEHDVTPALLHMGQVVLKARKARDLTQYQLAQMANMNSTSILMFESGRHNMTIRNIMLLAAALDLELGDLIVRNTPSSTTILKDAAQFLRDTSARVANQLRMMDRFADDLEVQSEK